MGLGCQRTQIGSLTMLYVYHPYLVSLSFYWASGASPPSRVFGLYDAPYVVFVRMRQYYALRDTVRNFFSILLLSIQLASKSFELAPKEMDSSAENSVLRRREADRERRAHESAEEREARLFRR